MLSISGLGIACNMGFNAHEVYLKLLSLNEANRNNILTSLDFFNQENIKILGSIVPQSNAQLKRMIKDGDILKKSTPRTALLALLAIQQALQDHKAQNFSDIDKKRVGLFCGTAQGGTVNLEQFYTKYIKHQAIDRSLLWASGYGCLNDLLAHHLGVQGPRYTMSTACSSSLAIVPIIEMLFESDTIDMAILYGSDPMSMLIAGGFYALQAMSSEGARPFSVGGDGMMLGEGAAAIIITRDTTGLSYGYISGFGSTSDSWHITAPHPRAEGASRSMRIALHQAEVSPDEIDFICAHGSGTSSNDWCESLAVNTVFGKIIQKQPAVFGIKGAFGHTLGAAGVFNLVVAALALSEGIIPSTPGLRNVRPNHNINVLNSPLQMTARHGLINAFGFGGNNASVVISRFKPTIRKKNDSEQKVFITGFGCINEVGTTLEEIEDHILRSCSPKITSTLTLSFSKLKTSAGAAKIPNEIMARVERLTTKYQNYNKMDRISKITLYSAIQAIKSSNFKISSSNSIRTGMLWGSGTGPLESIHTFYHGLVENGLGACEPKLFANSTMISCTGYTTIELGIKGPSYFLANDQVSSANSLHVARNLLLMDQSLEAFLCGGADEYSAILEKGYLEIDLLKKQGDESRQKGYILGEGSFCFLLEKDSKYKPFITDSFAVEYILGKQINYEIPGDNKYPQDVQSLYKELGEITRQYGFADMVIANYNGSKRHDNLIDTIIKSVFSGVSVYKPTTQFGYYLGSNTAFSFLCGILFFKNPLLARKITNKKDVSTIFIITIAPGGCFSVDILKKVSNVS